MSTPAAMIMPQKMPHTAGIGMSGTNSQVVSDFGVHEWSVA